MPQYEAGSDGKCSNIRQGVRRRIRFGKNYLLHSHPPFSEYTALTNELSKCSSTASDAFWLNNLKHFNA